jgi:3',5'-cyclic AMP phosphodiesterase CpdA
LKLVVISDPHLVPAGERLYELDPSQRLGACIADINEHHNDAELCVINGDLTYRGDIASYEEVKKCLDTLKIPYRLLMGNHDERSAFLKVFPDTPRDAQGFVQSTFESETARLVFLDTLASGYHYGELCEQRLAWLKEALADNPKKPTIVFMHHPPLTVGLKVMDMAFLKDAEKLAQVLSAYQNVHYLFCGHLHRPICGTWQGIPFCILRSTNHQVAFDLITDNMLIGCHEPPQYAVVFIETADIIIHFHDFLDPSEPFQLGGKNLSIQKNA